MTSPGAATRHATQNHTARNPDPDPAPDQNHNLSLPIRSASLVPALCSPPHHRPTEEIRTFNASSRVCHLRTVHRAMCDSVSILDRLMCPVAGRQSLVMNVRGRNIGSRLNR